MAPLATVKELVTPTSAPVPNPPALSVAVIVKLPAETEPWSSMENTGIW